MVRMKDEDYFHNLPHSELQDICRKNGLPANKTKPYLAKMLASWYQRKTTTVEKSNNMKDGRALAAPGLNVESELDSTRGTNKGLDNVTVRASDVECRWSSSYSKEIPVSTMNVVLRPLPLNNDSAKINRCSNFEVQRVAGSSQFGSECDDVGPKSRNKDTSDFIKSRDYNQKLVDFGRITGAGNIPQSQCSDKNLHDIPACSKLISSHGADKRSLPSFEFYVRSEEGINLCVDLNSSPLDWIQMLNDGVCIHQDVPNNKPWALHREIKSLGGYDEDEEKASSLKVNIGDPHTIDSSVGSTVREGNSMKNDKPDTADRLSRSVAVTQSKSPLEISGLQEENNKLNASLRGPNFDIRNPMNMRIKSSPRSFKKGSKGSDVRSAKQDELQSLGLDDLAKGEKSNTCSVGISAHNVRLPFPGETIEPNGKPFHSYMATGDSMELQLSKVAHICEDMSNLPYQNIGMSDSDNPTHHLQKEIENSAKCELDLNKSLDLLSEVLEERQRSDLTNEGESSECSQFDVKAKTYKRPNSSDSEGIQNKRQKRQPEDNNNIAIKNLRNVKDRTRRRLPRRSMRLVPK